MSLRMKPVDRKIDIVEAAMRVAQKKGFASLRQADIADEAACSYGTVSRYFGTMAQMRSAVMRTAIKRSIVKIVAEGLMIQNPQAKRAPDELKKKAKEYALINI